MNKFVYLIPLLAIVYLGYNIYMAMQPPTVPALVNRPMPEFELPEIVLNRSNANATFSYRDLPRTPLIIHAFASWCPTCKAEHKNIIALKEKDIPIYGIAYQDNRTDVLKMMARSGNPYKRIGDDPETTEMVKWGIRSLPSSWIIDSNGRVRYQHNGRITERDIEYIILPIFEKLRTEEAENPD